MTNSDSLKSESESPSRSPSVRNDSVDSLKSEVPQLPSHVFFKDGLKLHDTANGATRLSGVLEDEEAHKFYRLGVAEFSLVKCLLQNPSLAKAQASIAAQSRSLTEPQVLRLVQWLTQCGLTRDSDHEFGSALGSERSKQATGLLSQMFFLRLPVCNPDSALRSLSRWLGPLFSWRASAVGMVVAVLGGLIALSSWSDFLDAYQNLFTPWRGMWLLLVWLGLKLVHETAHGATCQRYGGNVPQAGVAFILLMPIAYVDVSSSWRFDSRWKRLHVTLAGVLFELFIAGLAMFVWLYADSPSVKTAAADVVLAASFSSLLFNLNPLLKFDGYFALADITGVDNLYQYGQMYARYFGNRYVLGIRAAAPRLPEGHEGWIKIYGLAAAVWRFVTVSGLIMGAAAMFAGAGVLLAIAGVFSFLLLPALKLFQHLGTIRGQGQLQWSRVAMRLGILGATVCGLLFMLPAEMRRTNPGIVEYDPPSVLHAPVDGFVAEIFVADGQFVEAGDPILRLQNDELQVERHVLNVKLQQTRQRGRSARWQNDASTLEEANTRAEALETQLWELNQKLDTLTVRAPHSGHVVSRVLKVLDGQYLKEGAEIGAVGNENAKRVKVSLSTWEANRNNEWRKQPVVVSIVGRGSWDAKVSKIESRATDLPPDPSLTAIGGGMLAVRQTEDADDPILVQRRVNAYIPLTSAQSRNVLCGQRCAVRLRCSRQSLGGKLLRYFDQMILGLSW